MLAWLAIICLAWSIAASQLPPLKYQTPHIEKRGFVDALSVFKDFVGHVVSHQVMDAAVSSASQYLFGIKRPSHAHIYFESEEFALPSSDGNIRDLEILYEKEAFIRSKIKQLDIGLGTNFAEEKNIGLASSKISELDPSVLNSLAKERKKMLEEFATKSYVDMPMAIEEINILISKKEKSSLSPDKTKRSLYFDLWKHLILKEKSLGAVLTKYRIYMISIYELQSAAFALWNISAKIMKKSKSKHSARTIDANVASFSKKFEQNIERQILKSVFAIPAGWMRELVFDKHTSGGRMLFTTQDGRHVFGKTDHLFMATASPLYLKDRDYRGSFFWNLQLDTENSRFIASSKNWQGAIDLLIDDQTVEALVKAEGNAAIKYIQRKKASDAGWQLDDGIEFSSDSESESQPSDSPPSSPRLVKRETKRKNKIPQIPDDLPGNIGFHICTEFGVPKIFRPPARDIGGRYLRYYINKEGTIEIHRAVDSMIARPFSSSFITAPADPAYTTFFDAPEINIQSFGQYFHYIDFDTSYNCRELAMEGSRPISKDASRWVVRPANLHTVAQSEVFFENQRLYSANMQYYLTLTTMPCILKLIDVKKKRTVWRWPMRPHQRANTPRTTQCQAQLLANGRIAIEIDNTENWRANGGKDEWELLWASKRAFMPGVHDVEKIMQIENDGTLVIKCRQTGIVIRRFMIDKL